MFTWKLPGSRVPSIIDYLLVRSNLRKEVHDVRVIWKGRNRQLPSPGADGNEPLWKEQNQEKIKKLAAEEQKVENERGKLRF